MQNRDNIDGLVANLYIGNWEERREATSTLASFGSESPSQIAELGGLDALVDALGDDNWIVRYEAAKGLGNIGEHDPATLAAVGGVRALKDALEDERRDVRWTAVESLQKIGTREPGLVQNVNGLEGLLRTVDDDNQKVRRKGVFALGAIGIIAQDALLEADVPCILRGVLDSQDDVLRALSAVALLAIEPETATTDRENLQQIVRNHLVVHDDPIWVVILLRDAADSTPTIVKPFEEQLQFIKKTTQGRLRRTADEILKMYE